MKLRFISTALMLTICSFVISCNSGSKGKEEQAVTTNERKVETKEETKPAASQNSQNLPPSERVDLTNKGVGPIKSLELKELDQKLADKGQEIYKNMCTACHKPAKRFIGPAPKGILERRTPEWVMNMILAPEKMLESDPLAKELLKEFNGAPMANQNLSEEDARAVLEYFRTL
ncbi:MULTISPECIES: c-type cytochrome [Myroides]|uniref:C-type cytochrome n=1 Tax=Myroides albus TaxID=2562892 RepID=A0A6I3LIU5_9FLAO|nr:MULTISPECIES: cytochrome c [Myroides]MTG98498.1 c-type cytochrome [Myroides albus]MVX34682.1 c-type cytochrome [Myroides sp. LoEW2-1]UVD79521.1 cytochrome c [Myroides albus]